MKRDLVLIGLVAITVFLLTRSCDGGDATPPPVPVIITKYDTVKTVQLDTIFRTVKVHTTDTVNLVISQTIVDTAYVDVISPPAERPALWPVLRYQGTAKWGDTATVATMSIQTGKLGISRIFQAGILTAIDVDSGNATPKFTYEPFPSAPGISLFERLKHVGIGAGIASVACVLRG